MKSITIAVDEDLRRRARARASERGTSLSALVRGFLSEYCGREPDYQRRKRLEQEILASIRNFDGGSRLDREALRNRDALR